MYVYYVCVHACAYIHNTHEAGKSFRNILRTSTHTFNFFIAIHYDPNRKFEVHEMIQTRNKKISELQVFYFFKKKKSNLLNSTSISLQKGFIEICRY